MKLQDIKVGMILVGTKGLTCYNEEKVIVTSIERFGGVNIKRLSDGQTGKCIPSEQFAGYYHEVQTLRGLME